jgi:hypothetical protein
MAGLAARKPSLPLQIDVTREDGSAVIVNDDGADIGEAPPRSPAAKLGSFFGWNKRNDSVSSSTTFSSPHTPMPSPGYFPPQNGSPSQNPTPLRQAKTMPMALDIPKANAGWGPWGNSSSQAPILPTPPASSAQVADLEQELREISTELANSIKREMELEDEVEKWKSQSLEQNPDLARRTSDYFSDSGSSSAKYIDSSEAKIEELERTVRKTELEKAQVKLDMSGKLAEVLKQRRAYEDRMHILEEHVTHSRATTPAMAETDRVKQLESALDMQRRKLAEERQSRENVEDLITGMRHEVQQYRNERDSLRNEVVPQLESKIASLEMFMSQSITAPDHNVETIAEDDTVGPLGVARPGLSRSRSSVAARRTGRGSRSNSLTGGGGLTRSPSVKELANEPREQLLEKMRDMEAQREALHKALRNLLERQKWQEKQYIKRTQQLEQERNKAMSLTPRRAAFNNEVTTLRDEISLLRRRADDALDQKWRCEKGLAGLKMDLDRARQETASLRGLLKPGELSIMDRPGTSGSNQSFGALQRQDSLNQAYHDLETTHALSVAHLRTLDSNGSVVSSANSSEVLALLKKSISDAQAERDAAYMQAQKYREAARELQRSEMDHLSKEQNLASELFESATHMDELAADVKQQIDANSVLRHRLAEAIDRGERDQTVSTARIAELQGKLKSLEELLVVAQQASEDAISGHEDEVRAIQETQNNQLQRSRSRSILSPMPSVPGTPGLFALRSPRLDKTSSGQGMSISEQTRTPQLESRVKELEKALADAELEMGEVVSRMNRAQIEVAELQSER